MDIVQHLFVNHPLLCVYICWPCWIPQNGTTPLFASAQEGYKEVVEILLQKGAEVNAAFEVVCDEQTDVIQRNACQDGRNEGQSVGMALAMTDCIEPVVHG